VALANDPDILLCDEPTGELDGAAAERVLVLLRQRAAAGAAVVVVTHSERVARDADRVLALRDGEAQE
jgi:putative ABC transport system ATP-binding protein